MSIDAILYFLKFILFPIVVLLFLCFFPKYFWSMVGWIHWCRTHGYGGPTVCTFTIRPSNHIPRHLSQINENLNSHKNLCMISMIIHKNFICTSKNLEKKPKMSFDRWVVKQTLVHHTLEYFSAIKSKWTNVTHNLNGVSGHYIEVFF